MSWQVVALILGLAALIVVDKLGCAVVNQRAFDKRARRAALLAHPPDAPAHPTSGTDPWTGP